MKMPSNTRICWPNLKNANNVPRPWLTPIVDAIGAKDLSRIETVQTLWKGYGQILRLHLEGAPMGSVILKQIAPPADTSGKSLSHQRKVRSYQIERTWYSRYSSGLNQACRVPRFLAQGHSPAGDWLLLEDLDPVGYPERRRHLNSAEMAAVVSWLAHFHASFLGQVAPELWEEGSYWHLDTRPDEWQALPQGPLKSSAAAIATKLKTCHFQTLIHGDAKPANFCFSTPTTAPPQVAAVDFQYIGRGCGMKDLAYFLSACCSETQASEAIPRYLDLYFDTLAQALDNPRLAKTLVAEWRELFDFAWADFYRFELGWLGGDPQDYPYSEKILQTVIPKLNLNQP